MKQQLIDAIQDAVNTLIKQGLLSESTPLDNIGIERTKQKSHGDFACNIALQLAKQEGRAPRELAQQIVAAIAENDLIDKVELAGPGFINIFVKETSQKKSITDIIEQKQQYGCQPFVESPKVNLEFVSANPTGPLHVGHGRGAAYGNTLARIMRAAGINVSSEYYVNDAGRQMHIMALSVWLRYLEEMGESVEQFPANAYQGEYIKDIAAKLAATKEDDLVMPAASIFDHIDEDPEIGIDQLIANAQRLLGKKQYDEVFKITLDTQLKQIQEDLKEFGVEFDQWFSEQSLHDSSAISKAIITLEQKGYIYEQDGAKWFRSTDFGDEKDRVIMRANGQYTYFAPDIAYLQNKFERGFEKLVFILGADHHGYMPRLHAAAQALGFEKDNVEVLFVQFAVLYRGGEKVSMSTRSGEFVTLEELRDEVGNDAARFFYSLRRTEQHLDFDLDLAKAHSNENPVYYVQYAHARISSILRQNKEELHVDKINLDLLNNDYEEDLIRLLNKYPDVINAAATQHEPHQVAYFLRELAANVHTYYNACKILDEQQPALTQARLILVSACKQVISNGLNLLGVSAPEKM